MQFAASCYQYHNSPCRYRCTVYWTLIEPLSSIWDNEWDMPTEIKGSCKQLCIQIILLQPEGEYFQSGNYFYNWNQRGSQLGLGSFSMMVESAFRQHMAEQHDQCQGRLIRKDMWGSISSLSEQSVKETEVWKSCTGLQFLLLKTPLVRKRRELGADFFL